MEEWNNRTKQDLLSARKFLNSIGKSKSREINSRAEEIHDRVFENIDCLDCANCCTSIPPIVNEMDVKRASKYLGLKPVEFKDKYIRIDDDLDMVINSSPCPFLQDDNRCEIYEARPRACREYPHTDNLEFSKHIRIHKKNIDYCPAAYQIVKMLQSKTF